MATRYEYTVNSDESFPNKIVDLTKFEAEIRASAITVALSGSPKVIDGNCVIDFNGVLNSAEEIILYTLVTHHDGVPLIQNVRVEFPNRQQENALQVAVVGKYGSECLYVSHDWCRKTTWYRDSVRVIGEQATNPSNDKKTYHLSHNNIIDFSHGYIYDEDELAKDISHGYRIAIVKDGDKLLSIREAYETSGGDYELNYESGIVTLFEEASSNVTVDYSYATSSTWSVAPYENTYLDIYKAKLTWSDNTVMTDSIVYTVVGFAGVFATELVEQGIIQPTDKIPLMTTDYKRFTQLLDESARANPVIKACPGGRGFEFDQHSVDFDWDTVRHLSSKNGMELRLTLKHNIPFSGERCTVTFRCIAGAEV